MLWYLVFRIKRIEVQLVQGQHENTYMVFKKLMFNYMYHISFMACLFVFMLVLAIYFWKIPKNDSSFNYLDDYVADYNKTFKDSKSVDIAISAFMVCLTINYFILALSVVRFLNFLISNKIKLFASYAVLLIFSAMYINYNFQMMSFYWGITAYQFNYCLFNDDCAYDNFFLDEPYSFFEYFAECGKTVKFFEFSL